MFAAIQPGVHRLLWASCIDGGMVGCLRPQVRKRWKFGELKRLPKPRPEARPRGGLQTEIMVMMPMDTVTVVEIEDGVERTGMRRCM